MRGSSAGLEVSWGIWTRRMKWWGGARLWRDFRLRGERGRKGDERERNRMDWRGECCIRKA